ncbi:Hypothetical predicted protein [Mytilus galloprovincialis]|uniref:Reverse transcriptase domain-containing protein n=2 Tax=Mytilus galloprovincialis TaxID=29158 RepID=A0A8B6GAU3_MYTGA|nr:Hypothetical predicted protein [Mytilus galloprovincialis]
MPRGYGGTAILWKKELDTLITPLTIGNERIQGIEISGEPNLIILSVYLPCKGTSDHIDEFQDCIALLNEIVCTYKLTHQIIIGGDLNEDIINGPSSQRKASFTEFMEDHSLETKFTGSTFIHSNGHDTTAIDYFLYQNSYKHSVLEIKKLDIGANVSDHYPIKMVLQHRRYLIQQKSLNDFLKPKINWDRIDKEKYENNINSKLSNKNSEIKSVEDITNAFTQLNEIIKQSTQALIPTRKIGRKRPKLQVMNEEIKVALKNKKIAFFKWKINGRPKETDNLYLKNKKQTTHALRKECRLEVAKRRLCERQKLVDARTADRKMFHKIIKNQRGKLSKFIDQLNVDDEIFYNEDIIEGWSTHFHQLAKKIPNPNYDNEYLELIENEAKIIIDICKQRFKHCPITNKEMEKAISDLNRNKAVDYFGINAENIIHGGKQLQQYLQLLFDKSFEFGCISDILKIGILFPVYKNKGDIKSAKNYRGITVTPTYSKLIEKIIKIRENPVILKNQNPLQRGFTENTTPLLCELMIEEFERESKDLKLPTYIALLDGKSAFDVVVHSNLIRRLYQAGISDQSIILIDSLYKNATSCVKWRNNTSQIFEIEQGVRQGGAISADLYKLYVNPLLNILSGTGLGGHIGDIGCCAPTCADDVAIISNNPMELQMLIDIAANFSKREGYTLQPTKSVVIPISTSTKSIEIDENYWNINKNPMPVVEHSTHIGIQKCQKKFCKTYC